MTDRHGLFDGTARNAGLAWLLTAGLAGLAVANGLDGAYRWFLFTGFAVAIVVLPAALYRDPNAIPPSELLVLVALPAVDAAWAGESALTTVGTYVAVAAVALVVAVEIHEFTAARMTHTFAVVLVVLTTLAVAAGWHVALWASDVTLGTEYIVTSGSQDAANDALMVDFALAAVAGVVAGVGFDRYFRTESAGVADRAGDGTDRAGETGHGSDGADNENEITDRLGERTPRIESDTSAGPSFVRGRLGVPESTVLALSRGMQVALGVLFLYGLVVLDVTTVVNAAIALAVTFLPTLLRRRDIPLEPELVFWLTAAVFLHALGSAGLYDLLGQMDSLTHALSATIVAAAGYAGVRAIDLHTDEISLPSELLFVFILVFVLAFGVVWELVEFAVDQTAQAAGLQAVLAQHGLDDTITDLVFDLVGALVVATWGSVYLSDLSERLAGELEG